MKKINGVTITKELEKAGVLGLPFSWGDDGVEFAKNFPEDKKPIVLKVFEDHDAAKAEVRNPQRVARKKALLEKLKLTKADIQGLSELIQDGTED